MQPVWREGESMVRTIPADTDWEPILRGGSNGLVLVITALSWWVCATKGHNSDLLQAIDDLTWVLSKLIAMLSATTDTGTKRPLEECTKEDSTSKKYVRFHSSLLWYITDIW
jgi:hypothetical protein